MWLRRIIAIYLVVGAGCAGPRPIHPLRLEGFPGAPIEAGLFPLRDGQRWVFKDRLDENREPLVLAVHRKSGRYFVTGVTDAEAEIWVKDGFLEITYQGKLVERLLKLEGKAGDTWKAGEALCTVFGYDRIQVLGVETRALVVAVERGPQRDLYWFATEMGWIRIRTERAGRIVRDALLVEFEPGTAN